VSKTQILLIVQSSLSADEVAEDVATLVQLQTEIEVMCYRGIRLDKVK
jgi:hypothetical protein